MLIVNCYLLQRKKGRYMLSCLCRRRGYISTSIGKTVVRSASIVLALCISLICVPQCYAADSSITINAPSNTSQVWVDVEGTNISPDKIGGTIDNKSIKFIASPSGVTSINALGGGAHSLALQAVKKRDNQLIFVTCADANNVILQESKLTVSLAGGLKIQEQHSNKTDNTDHNNTQDNHDSYSSSSDNNNQNASSENNSSHVSDKSHNNGSAIDKGNETQSDHNNANNSSNNSNSNIHDGSHSSSQVAKRKHFVSVLSATGVGMTCIVLVAAIAAFVGMSMRLNVNGAHAKKEK